MWWLDTATANHHQLKRRNDANNAWLGVQFGLNYDQIVLESGSLLFGDANDFASLINLAAYFRVFSGVLQHKEGFLFAVSDETTAVSAGAAKMTFRMPYGLTLVRVKATLNTASTSVLVTINIKEAGVSIFSTKLTIDANEKTSDTAAIAAVISDATLANDAEMTVDIDTAGSGAAGLKVLLEGWRT